MIGYYDYVLGLIPAALIGVTAVLNLVGLSLTAALPGGALVAGAIMAHAIFVRNPVAGVRGGTERSRDGSSASVRDSVDRAVERSQSGRSGAGASD
ncbi:hypothetical protein [Halorubrum yunnanense]|uniref:Uncharacterized protein n=1 Tax=Halorubrum yunnanense TaxID=1526162 RepID=A0ABD5YI90_9EURY|nr:hypothetical protein [Halorubrum yunnanense]